MRDGDPGASEGVGPSRRLRPGAAPAEQRQRDTGHQGAELPLKGESALPVTCWFAHKGSLVDTPGLHLAQETPWLRIGRLSRSGNPVKGSPPRTPPCPPSPAAWAQHPPQGRGWHAASIPERREVPGSDPGKAGGGGKPWAQKSLRCRGAGVWPGVRGRGRQSSAAGGVAPCPAPGLVAGPWAVQSDLRPQPLQLFKGLS